MEKVKFTLERFSILPNGLHLVARHQVKEVKTLFTYSNMNITLKKKFRQARKVERKKAKPKLNEDDDKTLSKTNKKSVFKTLRHLLSILTMKF